METDLTDIIDIANVFTNVDPTPDERPIYETLEDAKVATGEEDEEDIYAPI